MVRVPGDRIGAVFGELCQTSARMYMGSTMAVMSAVGQGCSSSESSVGLCVLEWGIGAGAGSAVYSVCLGLVGELGMPDEGGESSEEVAVCVLFVCCCCVGACVASGVGDDG